MKRTPLKRYSRLQRFTRLRKMSRKRMRDSIRYRLLRSYFMFQHPTCQVDGCNKPSDDVHHVHGRIGSRYLDQTTWLAVCRWHHDQIHQHPQASRAKGLLA